jgi:gliding motility-associated-like protein
MDKKLDNFESFIKSSMDNHETPYSNSAWESTKEAMNNNPSGSDGFESFVKKSLNNHEAPYASGAWINFVSLLNKTAMPFYKTKGFIVTASVIVIAGVILFSLPQDNDELKGVATQNIVKYEIALQNNVIIKNESKSIHTEEVLKEETLNEQVSITQEEVTNVISQPILIENEGEGDNNIGVTNITSLNSITLNTPEEYNSVLLEPEDEISDNTILYIVSFDAKLSACEGETINLTPREISKDLSYQWLLNGKSISKETTAKVILSKVAENNIDLIAYKKGERVSASSKVVNVTEKPKNIIQHNENKYSLVNNHSFKTNSDAKTVTWSFGDGEVSNELAAKHSYKKQGKYILSYNLVNEAGCSASYSKDLIVKGYYNIRQDHFFSPDGDGSLDVFLPEELKQINKPFEMIVYNRQNQIVYKTNSINNSWNGRDMEGNMVTFDAYIWVVSLINEYGNNEVYKGSVTKASN